MWIIGITGGVGAGKSSVLNYIKDNYKCRIILADEVGNKVKLPGEICYNQLVELLGHDILEENGAIDKNRMAAAIFSDRELLGKVNAVIHPAVKNYILAQIAEERALERYDFLLIEAALLIECGYAEHVDEMWYIHAAKETRKLRLKENRGYTEEKTSQIMQGQLKEEEFRMHCQVVIENSGDFADTKKQIDKVLGERAWKMQKNILDN